jgi:hypothetical protein
VKICPLSTKLFRTDGHAEVNSSFSQFRELAYKGLCYSASPAYRLQPFAYSTHRTPESENLPHSDGAQVFLIVTVKAEDSGSMICG